MIIVSAVTVVSERMNGQEKEGLPELFEVSFLRVDEAAGLKHRTIYGDEKRNRYLLETTGCGVAWFDYDNDGWLDLFFVNGTRFSGLTEAGTNRLYRNNRDGTFTDVTAKAGLTRTGWGQAVCIGDYDNDGQDDLFVSYYGRNGLFRNRGDGTFVDVTGKAGVGTNSTQWGSGAAFIDYDKDGNLDLFVAGYIDFDPKTAPLPETGPCLYKGIMVACGPAGLQGGVNTLYRNNGDGTFTDVSDKSGIRKTFGTYGLGVLTADFDDDGWPDIYVANDMAPAALYRNNKDGTFTDIGIEAGVAYSADGKPQAGMGVSAGDYDQDGRLDIFKTNFSGDTSTLYRNLGKNFFEDVTFASGVGINTRWLGWGCGFFDPDNDGWLDILLVNGHVYPEVEKLRTEAGYQQRKVLYRNLRNGNFQDVTEKIGGPLLEPTAARGCAFGDYDNDGLEDVVINPVNETPVLLRGQSKSGNNWIRVRAIGTKSNRSGIGARIICRTGDRKQFNEVRSGGSYYSQNDLRLHFGVGRATKVTSIEVRWPSGTVDTIRDVPVNRTIHVKEGAGLIVPGNEKR
ncbi:MAG: CRTAC1 family protein [Acidobacteriota bacterium]|nr:MAG: CRTAC1 family protein [Acidobacteriota bacterium]